MATRLSNPVPQHFDRATKAPLSGGKMFFYDPTTNGFKDTFADSGENTKNANPVILDASGFEPNIFGTGEYRIILQNSDGIQQWERNPVNFEAATGAFSEWDSGINYEINDIVEGSNGSFYVAYAANNATDPTLANSAWTQFDLLKRWNSNETYLTNDVVRSDVSGGIYTSLSDGNIGNQPNLDTTATFWKLIDNIRIDTNTISATNTDGGINIDSNGNGDVILNANNGTSGDVLINAGPTSGSINLNQGTTGDLKSNGVDISLAPVTEQIFTATAQSPWTKPAGVKYIIVELVGAGGAGGGANTPGIGGGSGGGAGAYARSAIDVSAITSVTLTIGVGGTGVADLQGNNGGDTTFDLTTVITAGGGIGGEPFLTSPNTDNGGTATNGDLNIRGGPGGGGVITGSLGGTYGGAAYFGGGAPNQTIATNNGVTATVVGSGGGGGFSSLSSSQSGGNGADGIIIVTEHR